MGSKQYLQRVLLTGAERAGGAGRKKQRERESGGEGGKEEKECSAGVYRCLFVHIGMFSEQQDVIIQIERVRLKPSHKL